MAQQLQRIAFLLKVKDVQLLENFPPQWNPEVQYRTQKRPTLFLIPSNVNSDHTLI
jgi:hypothetical protein